jgi:hypothetical protein
MRTRTLLYAAALSACIAGCSGSGTHGRAIVHSSQSCDTPFPTSLLLATSESSVMRMTTAGPQGVLPGTKNVLPHDLAISHGRCAVAITTEEDDSKGPLVVGSDGSTRRLHDAAGESNGIAWSPDDRKLAVSYQLQQDSSVDVVDVATGTAHQIAHFRGDSIAYHVAWLDNDTVLLMRVSFGGGTIDRIAGDGSLTALLTPAELGVGGIGTNTFAVDAPRHRLLLEVYDGTLVDQRNRRLVWVDLQTHRIAPAMDAPLQRADAPFAAVFSPGGDAIAFTVGRAGSGRYGCTIVKGSDRTDLPRNHECFELAWG